MVATILAVDDSASMRQMVSFTLKHAGYHVVEAVDGVEAFEMLRGTTGKAKIPLPDILLVDLNMPRMNGIQFVKGLREDVELHPLIVFILTTSKRDEDRVDAYDLNVAGYITKQRAAEDFLTLVNLVGIYDQIVEFP